MSIGAVDYKHIIDISPTACRLVGKLLLHIYIYIYSFNFSLYRRQSNEQQQAIYATKKIEKWVPRPKKRLEAHAFNSLRLGVFAFGRNLRMLYLYYYVISVDRLNLSRMKDKCVYILILTLYLRMDWRRYYQFTIRKYVWAKTWSCCAGKIGLLATI